MKISVVMTTYNGEKYVEEQLDSIRVQTRKADEVLIFDDQSSDKTVKIIQHYIDDNKLNNWKITVNAVNKGWRMNFFDGIQETSGDVIFLCDQDDIWVPDKIEKMVQVLEHNEKISVLASDYSIKLEGEKRSNYQSAAKQMKITGKVEMIPFDQKWYYVTRPGSTYCFRKYFFEEIKKDWNIDLAHDCNLWYFASAKGQMAIYHYATMTFRRHGDNASTEHLNTIAKRYQTAEMAKDVNTFFLDRLSSDKVSVLNDVISFCDLRMKYLSNRKMIDWCKLFLNYREYYLTPKGCIADLICKK